MNANCVDKNLTAWGIDPKKYLRNRNKEINQNGVQVSNMFHKWQ